MGEPLVVLEDWGVPDSVRVACAEGDTRLLLVIVPVADAVRDPECVVDTDPEADDVPVGVRVVGGLREPAELPDVVRLAVWVRVADGDPVVEPLRRGDALAERVAGADGDVRADAVGERDGKGLRVGNGDADEDRDGGAVRLTVGVPAGLRDTDADALADRVPVAVRVAEVEAVAVRLGTGERVAVAEGAGVREEVLDRVAVGVEAELREGSDDREDV